METRSPARIISSSLCDQFSKIESYINGWLFYLWRPELGTYVCISKKGIRAWEFYRRSKYIIFDVVSILFLIIYLGIKYRIHDYSEQASKDFAFYHG